MNRIGKMVVHREGRHVGIVIKVFPGDIVIVHWLDTRWYGHERWEDLRLATEEDL